MTLSTILERGRRRTTDVTLTDTVIVTRPDPDAAAPTFDEATMQYSAVATITVYRGPANFQVKVDINSNLVEAVAGEHQASYSTYQLQTPTEAPDGALGSPGDIAVDDTAECLASAHSPAMVGRRMNIHGPFHKSHATSLRFPLREVVA